MKILYAIQGTGNGHLSRAKAVIPALLKRAQVDILISGQQADVDLPFEIKYRYKGLSFFFGKKGGIDYMSTFKKNSLKTFISEIKNCPVQDYDLIINDFEPISAWASKFKRVNCISLSHQTALFGSNVPKPKHFDFIGHYILKFYARCNKNYGFHFKRYNEKTFTPIIRNKIREIKTSKEGHYTVYLPAYSDERILKILSRFKHIEWHVFSKKAIHKYSKKNIHFTPIKEGGFEKSIASCEGVLCGAGFETPAEALFLNKKLLVIPMKNQYEQHFNAAALKGLGVPVIKSLKKKYADKIKKWIEDEQKIKIDYPDNIQEVVDQVLYDYVLISAFV